MRRIAVFAAIVWGLAALEGCGGSDTAPSDAQALNQPKAPPAPPEVVTREFLEAVRTGDHLKADSLLTDLAREKTKQVDLVLAPTASQTAKYEVGEVEIMEGQVAHVESFWTDIGDDGKPKTIPFVWALRLDTNGWRIGGVASKLFDDAPLLLLNFEDPEDMLHKQAALEAEMTRRANGGAPAAATSPLAGGANGTATPGAPAPGAATPDTMAPGAMSSGQPVAGPSNLGAPGSFGSGGAPNMLPPGTATSAAGATTATQLPPGSIVPAGGISSPTMPGAVQPTGAQAQPSPGFLPAGAQAQQPLPPGNTPR
jgi:hypothetical protein